MKQFCLKHFGTAEHPRTGLLRYERRRHDGGFVLFLAVVTVLVGFISALAMCEIVVQNRVGAEKCVRRSAALAAASAGMERSKIALAKGSGATIFTDHNPVSFSGTLNNGQYSVNSTWTSGMDVQVASTGVAGDATCVLQRVVTATYGSTNLRGINYTDTCTIKFDEDVTFLRGRGPMKLLTPPEAPDYDHFRQLAIAQGHYYPGDISFQNTVIPDGVHFAEGNMTVQGQSTLNAGTLVCMGEFRLLNDSLVKSASWAEAAIIAQGDVTLSNGSITGAIYTEGDFLISSGGVNIGRVSCKNFNHSNGFITDGGVVELYTFLNGFGNGYNPTDYTLTYSGWSEAIQ